MQQRHNRVPVTHCIVCRPQNCRRPASDPDRSLVRRSSTTKVCCVSINAIQVRVVLAHPNLEKRYQLAASTAVTAVSSYPSHVTNIAQCG